MNQRSAHRRIARPPASPTATPINHILSYTEILLEDLRETGLGEFAPALRELNSGGRALLDWIQGALAESGSSVSLSQLEDLEAELRPRAGQLLRRSESLAARLREMDAGEALTDIERVSNAL